MEVREAKNGYLVAADQRVPDGFKQTEVGVIPDDWEVKRLDQLADIRSGGTPSTTQPQFWDGDVLWCTPTDITGLNGGKYLTDTSRKISLQGLKSSSAEIIPTNSVVMTSRATIGECAINRVPVSTNQGFKNFVPFESIDVEFLYYLLLAQKQGFISLCGGSTFLEIGKTQLRVFEVSLPPTKAEQEAIAEALSDADALIESLKQLLAKKRQLKQGAMQELLTGKKRLPGFSGEWSTVCMRVVLTQNATYGIVTAGTFVQNGVKMLRGGDIIDGRVKADLPMVSREKAAEYSRTALVKNDVVIALVGYPGASARIPDDLIGANISRAVGLLRLNSKVSADYMVCLLNSPDGRRMVLAPSAGSAQQVVNLAALNKLQFPIPALPEQFAIAAVLSDMDAEIAALEAKLTKARQLKQGIMQELLTGRIRLV
jgi:restriction endonuclease S subunit